MKEKALVIKGMLSRVWAESLQLLVSEEWWLERITVGNKMMD